MLLQFAEFSRDAKKEFFNTIGQEAIALGKRGEGESVMRQ
jgi:hypothetical protein